MMLKHFERGKKRGCDGRVLGKEGNRWEGKELSDQTRPILRVYCISKLLRI